MKKNFYQNAFNNTNFKEALDICCRKANSVVKESINNAQIKVFEKQTNVYGNKYKNPYHFRASFCFGSMKVFINGEEQIGEISK